MSNKLLLLGYLESILGTSKSTGNNNYSFSCPFCKHSKPKLEVKIDESSENNPWHCWHCDKKGRDLTFLVSRLSIPQSKKEELKSYVRKTDFHTSFTVKLKAKRAKVELPKCYKTFTEGEISKTGIKALRYLKKRGISGYDILKYEIGYCDEGEYKGYVIFPSYSSDNTLNYFVARNTEENSIYRYKGPRIDKNIVPFESMINWNVPIVLCEGIFDALAIKRNVIPLLGSTITEGIMKKILESNVKEVYIVLDKDKYNKSVQYGVNLMKYGLTVHLVQIPEGDPSELGFEKMTDLLRSSKPLDLREILIESLNI